MDIDRKAYKRSNLDMIALIMFFLHLVNGQSEDSFEDSRLRYSQKVDRFKYYMERDGEFQVTKGLIKFYSLEFCLDDRISCFGNNPESPYGGYVIDPIEGQSINDTDTLSEFRFRQDEALVIFGETPPPSTYFGFTHYLYRRYIDGRRSWKLISGSVDDTINPMNINVTSDGSYEDAFSKETVVVYTGDGAAYRAVEKIMNRIGVPSSNMNLGSFPNSTTTMGIDQKSDTVTFLIRIVNMYDREIGQFYLNNPPLYCLRVTPKSPRKTADIEVYPSLKRTKVSSVITEQYLIPALNRLQYNIYQQYAGSVSTSVSRINAITLEAALYGEDCIANSTSCYRDNSDSTYFLNFPGRFLLQDDTFIVYGVNHVKSMVSRYMSISIYDTLTFVAHSSINSDSGLDGSVDSILPYEKHRDKLFAFLVRHDCLDFEYCMEVPSSFPLSPPAFTTRVYLSNSTVAPDPKSLVGMRIIHVSTNAISSLMKRWKRRRKPEVESNYNTSGND